MAATHKAATATKQSKAKGLVFSLVPKFLPLPLPPLHQSLDLLPPSQSSSPQSFSSPMTTMSDDGDRTCPLCAEEMDLTDQQLKPCKCGYEICVWCWHHIMEMAEKEGSDGRCPACRTAYDKQRIVGMAANCKRMVAEVSAEKKHKTQKTKNKSSSTIEDRKHLSSVRVVQKNLVYIMGMPSNLSDENILERKEYFGQYGKILKVSVSKQAGPTPQHAANSNTFSVYITYAREEEAVRCIQAVHNFVLEGKPLRACYGTTKYCYTWLRNQSCNNPDCLYLHDIGSEEDSFTKDEIISAYTRSRVPQIPLNNLQPRAGNVLPPPVDDIYYNGPVSTKQSTKSSFNNTTSQAKSSPIDTSGARSTVLPAAASWGLRASNCRPTASNSASSQNSLKQKIEVLNNSSNSSMVSSTKQISAWHDDVVTGSKIPDGRPADGRSRVQESRKHGNGRDHLPKASDASSGSAVEDQSSGSGSAWDDDITVAKMLDRKHTTQASGRSRNRETYRPANASSVSHTPEEIVLDEDHSAWDDDTVLTSNMPGESQIVHNDDRFRSTGTLEPGIRLSRTSSDITSKDFPDAAHSSGVSISCSPGQLSLHHESSDNGATASTANTDPVNITFSEGAAHESSSSFPDELSHVNAAFNGNTESLCLGLSSVNLDTRFGIDHINAGQQQNSVAGKRLAGNFGNLNSGSQQYYPENGVEYLTSVPVGNASAIPDTQVSEKLSDWRSELQKQVLSSSESRTTDALAATDDQRHRLSVLTNLSPSSYKTYSLNGPSHLTTQNDDLADKRFSVHGDSRCTGAKVIRDSESLFLNGHEEQMPSSFAKSERVFEYPNSSYTDKEVYSSGFDNISNIERNAHVDTEEDGIVSKMLSSDFDPWDNSWSSTNDFAKLLAQMNNKQEGPSKMSGPWKPQSSDQSRFLFARQETRANLGDSAYRDSGLAQQVSSKDDSYGNSFRNTYPVSNFERANVLGGSSSTISSDVNAGVTRTKISAPPGFSVPNRAPPPGFSSQDRYDQAFSACSETQLLGSPLQNQFQVHSTSNAGDVEFIDPAILAVGKGRLPLGVNNSGLGSRSVFHPQFGTSENDTRIQLLMQQSTSAGQDSRIQNHMRDRFLQLDDTYTSSRFSAQNPSLSPFSQMSHQQPLHILNSQWNGWNDMQIGNGMGVREVLRSERFGLNNYFPVNEEPKFHLPNSGDIYNRAFGI